MLTAIVDARSSPLAISATLGPLVRGVVQGLVGSAVLVAAQATRDLEEVADAGGCRLLVAPNFAEGFTRAVAAYPQSGLLVLDSGMLMGIDFWPVLADHLPLLGDRPAATLPASRAGIGGIVEAVSQAFRPKGRVNRRSALLLPPRVARSIAHMKSDPWRHAYGAELAMLPVRAGLLPK